jgi:formylmethanofuran dehydrogenase subunit C
MMAVGQSAGQMAAMVADGGPVLAPGGPTDDAGAVAISDGEYVIPADVVRKLGTNHFDKLIEKETGRPPPSTKQAIPIPTDIEQPAQAMPQQMGGIIQ